MAQTLETIRLLRIRSIFEGDGLQRATQMQDALARAVDKLGRTTDASANKQLSATRAWDAYLVRTDNVTKALFKAGQAVDVMTRKFSQLSPDQQTARFSEFNAQIQKVWQNLDKLGVPRNIDLGGNLGTIRQQVEENIKALERQRQMEERILRDRDIMRQANPPDSHVQMFRQREQQAKTLADLEKSLSAEVATFDRQRLAERASLQSKINEMLQKAMPIESQRLHLDEQRTQIDAARAKGLITEVQQTALLADLERRRAIVNEAAARHQMGNRLNRADMTNLGYQLNDIVTMLASGASPMQIMATQGPQIAQILGAGEKGIVGSLKSMGLYMQSLLTPTRVLFGSLAAGAITAYAAWQNFDSSVKSVERSMLGMGRATGASLDTLLKVSEQVARGTNLAPGQARDAVGAFAGTGRIDPSLYADAAKAAENLAVVTGTTLPEANEELAKALADPAKGLADLDAKFNLFSATELRAAQRMAASGNIIGAQTALLRGLENSIGGATNTLTGFERLMKAVGETARTMWNDFGRDIAEVAGFSTMQEQLEDLERRRTTLQKNRELVRRANPPNLVQQLAQIDIQATELAAKIADLQDKMGASAGDQMRARAQLMSKELQDLTKDFDPLKKQLDDTNDRLSKLRAMLEDPLSIRLDTKAIENAISVEEGRAALQGRQLQAGGAEALSQRQGAEFNARTAGITEFGRAIEDINERYRRNVEAIQGSGLALERQNALLETEKRVRDANIQSLERQTAIQMGRQIAPEMFELGDLQNTLETLQKLKQAYLDAGMSAEQYQSLLDKANRAIENYRTPLQQLTEQFDLSVKNIQAFTIEQQEAVTREEALAEARRRGLDDAQELALIEGRLAELRARNQSRQYESYLGARNEAGLVGMKPFQREQAQIGQEFEGRRTREGDSAYLRDEEALRRWTAAQEMLRGPLEDANNELNDQIRLTRMQAETYGASVAEIEAAAEAQRLMNEYMRQGVEITPELAAAIQNYAQRAGQLRQVQTVMRETERQMEDFRDMGKDALKGFISDLKEGKSAGEALLNVMQRLLDRLLDMTIDSLFDSNKPNPLSTLFGMFTGNRGSNALAGGGGLGSGLLTTAATALPSTAASPFGFSSGRTMTMPPAALSAAPLRAPNVSMPQINQETFGPIVPTFKQATAAVRELGAASGNATGSFDTLNVNMEAAAKAFRTIESGSPQGDYSALGKVITDPKSSMFGERAYGAYQVMGPNIGPWTQKHFGQRLTPEEFRANPVAQDMVFQGEIGPMIEKYGIEGAGRWWYGGPRGLRNWQQRDMTSGGQTTGQYGSRLGRLYEQYGGGQGGGELSSLSTGVDQASQSFQNLNPSLDQFGQGFQSVSQTITQGVPQLQQNFNQLPSMIGQGGEGVGKALEGTAGVIGQGSQGIGSALNQLGQALSSGGGGGGGGLGGLFSGLFGGGGGGWGGYQSFDWNFGMDFSGLSFFHSGGRVGAGGGSRRPMPLVDILQAMYAPRFHSGKSRVGHDERMAVLQTDEEVLSRTQAREYRKNRGAQGQGGAQAPQVNVNVINNAGADVKTEQRSDGSIDVLIEQAEGRMAERAKRGRGPLVKAIGSRREGNALIG